MKQEVGAAVITSNATQGPSDLIRQLNLARAQGLVVLQQWGTNRLQVCVLLRAFCRIFW